MKSKMTKSQETYNMIQDSNLELSVKTILQLFQIVTILNERMDAAETEIQQIQNEHKPTNT